MKPTDISNIEDTVIQIAAGHHHVLALTHKGELFGWGSNIHSQLAAGTEALDIKRPQLFDKELFGERPKVVQVFAAKNHSLCITKVGTLYFWGAVSIHKWKAVEREDEVNAANTKEGVDSNTSNVTSRWENR